MSMNVGSEEDIWRNLALMPAFIAWLEEQHEGFESYAAGSTASATGSRPLYGHTAEWWQADADHWAATAAKYGEDATPDQLRVAWAEFLEGRKDKS